MWHATRISCCCCSGKAHELVTLAELVDQLHKETDELKVQIMEREEKLSFLFKTASKVVLEFEEETEEMIYALRKTRNEQVLTPFWTQSYLNLDVELRIIYWRASQSQRLLDNVVRLAYALSSVSTLSVEYVNAGSECFGIAFLLLANFHALKLDEIW